MDVFSFPGQTRFYQGKVRDVYSIGSNLLVMHATDRISAFDVVLPHPIPFKGQVLNQLAAFMLEACRDICPNWLIECPAPVISIGHRCEPFRVEVVVRGNLTGHSWRTYQSGERRLCGAQMPTGLRENDFFPSPLITPSTKASAGHDEDISSAEIISQGLATAAQWEEISTYALQLFQRGKEIARKRGLVLADTKYEFGLLDGSICLMDEIHTPDSSRFFILDGFEERQSNGMKQKQLSKEFVREWLMENNFMGKPGQVVPEMTEQWIASISNRYIELFEKITGEKFHPVVQTREEIEAATMAALRRLQQ